MCGFLLLLPLLLLLLLLLLMLLLLFLVPQVLLTASARGGFHDEQTDPAAGAYQSFGVGAAEVEVDCVTGERRLLRADIMFDAGKSVSPAIDMGQASVWGPGERGCEALYVL